MVERVEAALDEIRPALQMDGGDVELVDIDDDGLVRLRLVGACHGCPMSQFTLQMGIEHTLKARIPEVAGVQAVNYDDEPIAGPIQIFIRDDEDSQ
ncbi:MAG: NifU family protein [Armatimonadetes bacterium]|nr:NifU family protein [Armatimonadota bacterium]